MVISDFSKEYYEKMFLKQDSALLKTDPKFIGLFDNFAFDEVVKPDIGGKETGDGMQHMTLLATLIGCQGIDGLRTMLPAAMNFGVTLMEIKNIVY